MLIELKYKYKNIPLFTRLYLSLSVLLTIILNISQSIFDLKLLKYVMFDFDKIIYRFEYWRLFTNYFIIGKFGIGFLIKTLMIYFNLNILEKQAKSKKTYPDFIMMIVYVWLFINMVSLVLQHSFYLSSEFMLTIIFIECQRDPEGLRSIYGLQLKGRYYINKFIYCYNFFPY